MVRVGVLVMYVDVEWERVREGGCVVMVVEVLGGHGEGIQIL